MTETRSGARRCSKYSAVMIETIDADEAWWPPTFTPDGVRAHPVGVVDDRRREPQHAVLHRLERPLAMCRVLACVLHGTPP